jgi:ATP-dependent Lon protease
MKESAIAATSYLHSLSRKLNLEIPDGAVHIHVPAGAIPKDGPSAGVTMAAALASFTAPADPQRYRHDWGDTLSGLVLPVGGIKERCWPLGGRYSSHCPSRRNRKDRRTPDYVKAAMEFVFQHHRGGTGWSFPDDRRGRRCGTAAGH